MPINSISEMFVNGISISNYDLTINSGSLVSCPNPELNDPNEVIFGFIETMYRAVESGIPDHITAQSTTSLRDDSTLRKTYSFTIDLAFDGGDIIETLNVKPDATTTTTTTAAP